MSRINGKNNMRTAAEKHAIAQEYVENGGQAFICQKYDIDRKVLWTWTKKYLAGDSFENRTGKNSSGRSRSKVLSLEEELEMLKIENEFLKKVYNLTNSQK